MVCATGTPDWSNATLATFNLTLLMNPELCTSCTCPLVIEGQHLGYMSYFPSLPGNAVFAAVFGLCLLPQIFFGIRHRTWGYLISMSGGLILEVIGYVARILMRDNMFTNSYFVMYVFPLFSLIASKASGLTANFSTGTSSVSPSAQPSSPQPST
jgi:hypothetical protein